MNTKMNKSQYDWYMHWFKRHVRSIVSDLENLPHLAAEFNKDLTTEERKDLAAIIPEVKLYCIELYRDYESGERDIRDYVKDLRIHFDVYWCVKIMFLGRTEPAMSPDEEPSAIYNSLDVDFEDLHFSLQEKRYDEHLCEMAETHGMGYDCLDTWQELSVH